MQIYIYIYNIFPACICRKCPRVTAVDQHYTTRQRSGQVRAKLRVIVFIQNRPYSAKVLELRLHAWPPDMYILYII